MASHQSRKVAIGVCAGFAAALLVAAPFPAATALGAHPSAPPSETGAEEAPGQAAETAVTNDVQTILKMARESEKNDSNVNFFGFYTGMPEGDAYVLANSYGLKKDQWSYLATPLSRRVYLFKFVPRAVRTVSGGGKIYADLAQVVSNRVGAMTAVDDGTFFPRYEYESASGIHVQLSKLGGLVVSNATYAIRAGDERLEAARRDAKAAVSETAALATRRLAGDMVKIPGRGYAIGKCEVTQALWYAATGEVPSRFTGGDLPVESVSWDDCQAFLERLNALPEVKASGFTYRLPTAAEWEYACKAGGVGDYCRLGEGAEVTSATLKEVSWYGEDRAKGTPHAVGQKKPNAFGLYDMHGNVWEWVAADDGDSRTACGGGWRNGASTCTSGSRSRHFGEFSRDDIGLRLAADCQ